jgi:hypothetical protein
MNEKNVKPENFRELTCPEKQGRGFSPLAPHVPSASAVASCPVTRWVRDGNPYTGNAAAATVVAMAACPPSNTVVMVPASGTGSTLVVAAMKPLPAPVSSKLADEGNIEI